MTAKYTIEAIDVRSIIQLDVINLISCNTFKYHTIMHSLFYTFAYTNMELCMYHCENMQIHAYTVRFVLFLLVLCYTDLVQGMGISILKHEFQTTLLVENLVSKV